MEHIQPGRVWDRRMRVVIMIFSVVHAGAGKLEIRRTDSPIEAPLGHNTTIPCHISGYKASYLDISKVHVRWKRADELVYLFNSGRHTQYRSGSYISERGLAGGDASLYMPDIRISDEGEYSCFVIVTPNDATSTVTVRLSAMPSCRLSDSSLVMNSGTEKSVTCYVNGFYPESVRIQWLKYRKASNQSDLNSQTCTSMPVQNQDGTYNVTSALSVRPVSAEEDGDVYSCVVSHRSLTGGLNCTVSLSVHPAPVDIKAVILSVMFGILVLVLILLARGLIIYRYRFKKGLTGILHNVKSKVTSPELVPFPHRTANTAETAGSASYTAIQAPSKVMEIFGPELTHMKKTKLACNIGYFRPKYIDLSLYIIKDNETILVDKWSSKKTKNNQEIPLLNPSLLRLKPSIIQTGDGFFSCICFIAITPQFHEHDGAKMILQIEHEAVKDPIYKERTLRVTAPPVLDPIKTNQESYNIGDHLELTCTIHSFHPQKIKVTWSKDKETLLSENNEAGKDINGLFYVTSRVQATIQEEDFGKVFRCKAEHQRKIKASTWKLQKQVDASESEDGIDP